MSKRNYHLEPQALRTGQGYVSCAPHQACRFVLIETTTVPASRNRRAYQIKRVVAKYSGPSAESAAHAKLAKLIAHAKPKAVAAFKRRPAIYRSLTTAEYLRNKGV